MSFQGVQSRITHAHLTVRLNSASGVYVDAERHVIGVIVDSVSKPSFRNLLPRSYQVGKKRQATLQPTFSILTEFPQSNRSHDTIPTIPDGQNTFTS